MKRFGLLAALCALSIPTFGDEAPQQITLKEGITVILNGGIEIGNDPEPISVTVGSGGTAENYCQATMNSFNLTASMGHTGSLDLADGTFALTCTGSAPIPTSWGMFTYGTVQTNTPFGNGYLCISPFTPGIFKMPTQQLGASTIVFSMQNHPANFAAFTPSSSWYFQFWYRDPPAGGANFNLSDGLHVVFAP